MYACEHEWYLYHPENTNYMDYINNLAIQENYTLDIDLYNRSYYNIEIVELIKWKCINTNDPNDIDNSINYCYNSTYFYPSISPTTLPPSRTPTTE